MEVASAVWSSNSKGGRDIDDLLDSYDTATSEISSTHISRQVSLDLVSSGTNAVVVRIDRASPSLYRRLTQLGLVPGTNLKVIRVAPLGCPVQIELRGFCLALRLAEASAVFVTI